MAKLNTTLYSYFRSSASYRIRIALNWKNINYEQVPINLLKEQNLSDAFATISPYQKLPVLKINGMVLTQSMAILDYLEETYPTPALLSNVMAERQQSRELAQSIACDIHPLQNSSVLKLVFDTLQRHQKNPAEMPNLTIHSSSLTDSNLFRTSIDDVKREWAYTVIYNGFKPIEKVLEKTAGKYCVGNTVSFADVCLAPQVVNAYRWGVDLNEFPNISEITHNLNKLEPFQKAHPLEQPDAPKS